VPKFCCFLGLYCTSKFQIKHRKWRISTKTHQNASKVMVFCEHLQNCGGFIFAIYSCSSKRRTNSLWLQMGTCCLVGVDCPLNLCLLVVDDTKQGANSLGLLVQIVVARLNFLHEETQGLYRTLREHSKKLSSFFVKQPTKKILVLCPQLHRVVVKHKV
jgi:hypothetical protein